MPANVAATSAILRFPIFWEKRFTQLTPLPSLEGHTTPSRPQEPRTPRQTPVQVTATIVYASDSDVDEDNDLQDTDGEDNIEEREAVCWSSVFGEFGEHASEGVAPDLHWVVDS